MLYESIALHRYYVCFTELIEFLYESIEFNIFMKPINGYFKSKIKNSQNNLGVLRLIQKN